MEKQHSVDCITTFTGLHINVFEPTPEMICIEDIAHSLSMQCRFGGHVPNFYSVAQHSLNCSYLTETDSLKLQALMHDASEAYLLDMPSPIKKHLPDYKRIENNLMAVIAKKFNFGWPLDIEVKKVDELMFQQERDILIVRRNSYLLPTKDMYQTEQEFIKTFNYLQKEYGNI